MNGPTNGLGFRDGINLDFGYGIKFVSNTMNGLTNGLDFGDGIKYAYSRFHPVPHFLVTPSGDSVPNPLAKGRKSPFKFLILFCCIKPNSLIVKRMEMLNVNGDDVADQFVKHFERFLLNNGGTEHIDNPDTLFLNKLSKNEAEYMVGDITDKEIKEAMFGIGNDKAPGPDGFTAMFFKKSWDIVGMDVCGAIKEFFNSNKLFGEINATLITLVLKIIGWIMTCVTSASFTVCVNGGKYRYFKSRRGLRQGDLMSPYLFTLIMEVLTLIVQRRVNRSEQFKFHWGCKGIKLTQLCFADDLLMLCNGDHKSVQVLKECLMGFSKISGLVPNMNKSTIFFGNVREGERQRMLKVMPFVVGTLPMKYLGIPLITKNIGISECNQLVERVKQKVNDWKNKALSYAGRLYGEGFKGISLVPWRSKESAAKVARKVISNKDSLWVKWVNTVKLKNKSIWEVDIDESDNGTWKAILNLRNVIRDSIWKEIRDGRTTNVWFDKWSNEGPLCDIIPFKKRYEARMDKRASVADMIVNGVWNWPKEWETQFRIINDIQIPILREGEQDGLIWKDQNENKMKFSIRSVWEKFKERKPEISWHKVVWYPQCNPRYAFIVWLAMHKRLATQDRIMAWNKNTNLKCPLCSKESDSHEHLFFKCPYSEGIWRNVTTKMGKRNWDNVWEKVACTIAKGGCKSNIKSVLDRMEFSTTIYFVWNERNKRIFTQEQRNCQDLLNGIVESIKM
ncbi:RNA-directed DNA polymerase, eukaryota, reverse transcriptase zinc-binding domain protein [Tanacetum coccineum]